MYTCTTLCKTEQLYWVRDFKAQLINCAGRNRPMRALIQLYDLIVLYSCIGERVSWCFKPSQPQRIISGLKEIFIKRYI